MLQQLLVQFSGFVLFAEGIQADGLLDGCLPTWHALHGHDVQHVLIQRYGIHQPSRIHGPSPFFEQLVTGLLFFPAHFDPGLSLVLLHGFDHSLLPPIAFFFAFQLLSWLYGSTTSVGLRDVLGTWIHTPGAHFGLVILVHADDLHFSLLLDPSSFQCFWSRVFSPPTSHAHVQARRRRDARHAVLPPRRRGRVRMRLPSPGSSPSIRKEHRFRSIGNVPRSTCPGC
mmetsp:Transcript_9180/g.55727  ORF Transcript_9180/g.55727 Transcript_9180/m.55727 type:complete len:227 (-) Transcript_9180:4-684(-)